MLKEGDVIELKKGHQVYADVPEHFLYSNKRGVWDLTHGHIVIDEIFSYFAGKYVVFKTSTDGGGTGHGPGDVYPDGHHVFCRKVEGGIPVDFYQSGSFTAMIEDIKPIGKATLSYILDDVLDDESPSGYVTAPYQPPGDRDE